jgi:hypothetical protein
VQCVQPDIAAPVSVLAAYNSAPTKANFAAMLDVIWYVGSTAERGIAYGQSSVPVKIWCDAKFAPGAVCLACLVLLCFGGAVSWESCRQRTTAVATMDAEYQACGSVAREALSLCKLLREFSVLSGNVARGGFSCVV